MDPKQTVKQIMDFNKKAFDNSFIAMCVLQAQGERTFDCLLKRQKR